MSIHLNYSGLGADSLVTESYPALTLEQVHGRGAQSESDSRLTPGIDILIAFDGDFTD